MNNEIEGNKAILEFLGYEFVNDDPEEYPMGYYQHPKTKDWLPHTHAKYHSSWDWFMDACKKANEMIFHSHTIELDEEGKRLWDLVEESILLFNKKSTHNYFTKFLQWYKEQKAQVSDTTDAK